jgi:hypothetical protein
MYQFAANAPLDATEYPEPAQDDRSGIPLTQGLIMLLISTTASEHCTPEVMAVLKQIKPESWYAGQLLETILNSFEQDDPELVIDIGKNIYYTLEGQFRAMGLQAPADVINTLPMLWQHVTRGDSGEWRNAMTGPNAARVELEQPYNCRFEQGALQGALECFDADDVVIDHVQCMREGAPFCVLEVKWQ